MVTDASVGLHARESSGNVLLEEEWIWKVSAGLCLILATADSSFVPWRSVRLQAGVGVCESVI